MRKRGLLANPRRRLPLPPGLREPMKTALRKVHVEQARRRGEIRKRCRQQLAAAKLERNRALEKLDEEYGQRAQAIRAEYEAKASERLLKTKVAGAATGEEF